MFYCFYLANRNIDCNTLCQKIALGLLRWCACVCVCVCVCVNPVRGALRKGNDGKSHCTEEAGCGLWRWDELENMEWCVPGGQNVWEE